MPILRHAELERTQHWKYIDKLALCRKGGDSGSTDLLSTTEPLGDTTLFPDVVFADPNLSGRHKFRLLTGHFSLTQVWQYLVDVVPALDRSPLMFLKCTEAEHAETCTPAWENAWRTAIASRRVTAVRPSDILGRLRELHLELGPVYASNAARCGTGWALVLPALTSRIHATMADHFLGVLSPPPVAAVHPPPAAV
ncbi:hypothetical protein C8R43DRAFT_958009 [Mycena crocata]|nr:hypothetical protein C8R43DRAFT_958009 [Mycena crocata]